MKQIIIFLIAIIFASCEMIPDAFTGASKKYDKKGNSMYHRADDAEMTSGELMVVGEVKSPGKIDLDNFYKREIFVKEVLAKEADSLQFVGAYRYRGYSLFDLLNSFVAEKKNREQFRPEVDLYVIVENDKGERVVFSWGEVFHDNNPHQILIATESSPIKPYKKEVEYPTNKEWKLVAGNDFYSYRTLQNPTKVTVKSFDKKEYAINKGMKPAYSPKVDVFLSGSNLLTINQIEKSDILRKYNSAFYGMGMGYHNNPNFQGIELQTVLHEVLETLNYSWFRKGLLCFVGIDGYRSVYSYSELFNRVDQQQAILAIPENPLENGYYRIYHPSKFWADYSVSGLKEIFLFKE